MVRTSAMARIAEKLSAEALLGIALGGVVAKSANMTATTSATKNGPNLFMRFPLDWAACCPPHEVRSISA
jgi:hypothetical protein